MKKTLFAATFALCLAPSIAFAQPQIHLAWTDCSGGPYGTGFSYLSNNCNSNNGSLSLVGSVVPPALPTLTSAECILDVVQPLPISPWWRFDAAGCRNGSLTDNFDFTAGPFNCNDPWLGRATGSMFVTYPGVNAGYPPGNTERFDVYCSVATPVAVDDTQEWYVFKVVISRAGTVGGCSGCNVPTSIQLNSITLGQPYGASGGNPTLTGDGVTNIACHNCGGGVVPAHTRTWGQIKALYR